MIRTTIVGRLTHDIELKETNNGIKFAKFTVASKNRNKDEEGHYLSDFMDCIAWRTTGENIAKFQLKKGFLVEVTGDLISRVYDGQKGDKIKAWTLEVSSFENLTTKDEANEMAMKESVGGSKTSGKNDQVKFEPIDEDNLPF